MKKKYAKYFWSLNKKALEEVEDVLKESNHPKFNTYMVTILSRCQNPKELFVLTGKENFIKFWPKLKKYWKKISPKSNFIDWWQTVYEQLLTDSGLPVKSPPGDISPVLVRIGKMLRKARVDSGLSQKELALKVGIKQPDISKMEEGKSNITLSTLFAVCKALEIKEIELH